MSAQPERVVLPRRPGTPQRGSRRCASSSAPSRRSGAPSACFVWSIERVRDPARDYEITLLRELPGFERRGWTTGFTNYRFAIPELCGGRGRAIYNDVDQIYRCDPAVLFDLDRSTAAADRASRPTIRR